MSMSINIKSFLFGVGKLLDVGATFNFKHTHQANYEGNVDMVALSQDWNVVGNDIRHAIDTIESERVT